MKELKDSDLKNVVGGCACIFSSASSVVGNAMIDSVRIGSALQNTKTLSLAGETVNAMGLGPVHKTVDSLVDGLFKNTASAGSALGGDSSNIGYHYDKDWN